MLTFSDPTLFCQHADNPILASSLLGPRLSFTIFLIIDRLQLFVGENLQLTYTTKNFTYENSSSLHSALFIQLPGIFNAAMEVKSLSRVFIICNGSNWFALFHVFGQVISYGLFG